MNRSIIRRGMYKSDTIAAKAKSKLLESALKWKTRMKTASKIKIGIAVAVLIAAIFLPEVVSAAWHVAHGRTANYRAWQVVVPFGWYASRHGEGMSVERMSEIPWEKGPAAEFLPVHFTKTYPFSYDLFGKEQQSTLRAMGYLPLAQRDIQIAGQDGRCWTFHSRKSNDQLWIACIVPKDLTSADFIGDKSYANAFFSLLTESRRNPDAKE